MNRADLRAALSHPNVAAFLRVIREGESGQAAMAYRMRYGGAGNPPKFFDDLSRHPKIFERTPDNLMSSAAGAYQATWTTWIETATRWGLPDFSEQSQDEFAVARLIFRGALDDVKAGRFEDACRKCATEWTSLPGGAEANAATARARATWEKWLAILESTQPVEAPADPDDWQRHENYGEAVTESTIRPIPSADQQEARNMPAPLIPIAIAAAQAFLPRLAELIPSLGAAFGSGSEVQKRNVAAASLVAEAVTKAVGEPNLQAAIEQIERDPAKLATARAAVSDILPTLVEAGGGGIKGARDTAAAQSGDWRKLVFSLPFVGILVFVPTIWAVVAAAVFSAPWLLPLDAQMRGTVIGFVMGTIAGGIVMYVYGASMTKAAPQPATDR